VDAEGELVLVGGDGDRPPEVDGEVLRLAAVDGDLVALLVRG